MQKAVTQKITVACHGHTLAAEIVRPEKNSAAKPAILILHGGGGAHMQHSAPLAEYLATHGHSTLRFDHSGHGHSTGHLAKTSMARKLAEAQAMASLLGPGPHSIIASSLSAQTASQLALLPTLSVSTMVFIAPAAYGAAMLPMAFDAEFNFLTQLPGYWADSPAWPALESFTGKLLHITAGLEHTVPGPITRAYWHHARHAARTQLHLPLADHSIQAWLQANPAWQQLVWQQVLSFLP